MQGTSMVWYPHPVLGLAFNTILVERSPGAFFALFHPFGSPDPACAIICSHTIFQVEHTHLDFLTGLIMIQYVLIAIQSQHFLQIALFPSKYPLYAVYLYSHSFQSTPSGVQYFYTLYSPFTACIQLSCVA